MKKLLCILFILNIFCIQSIQAYEYPTIIPYINDFTSTLSQDQINLLNQHCDRIEKNTSYEIAIVVVNTTDGQDRLEYANHIGENNGVGKKATGTGLVVLWTFDNERGLAIATARGAGETYINDAKAAEIARTARPLFEDKKYYEGFEQILNQLEQTIKERDVNAVGTGIETQNLFGNYTIAIFIIFGVVAFILFLIFKISRGGKTWGRGTGTGIVLGGLGSGGGGGVSFGGASFGGGGGRG